MVHEHHFGIVIWIIAAILIGAFAQLHNRNGIGWMFLSLIVTPFVAMVLLSASHFREIRKRD